MNPLEKTIIIVAIVYVTAFTLWNLIDSSPIQRVGGVRSFMLLFWTGMALAILSLAISIRDFTKRRFASAHWRTFWLILLLLGGTPGWLAYLWRHGFRPRPAS